MSGAKEAKPTVFNLLLLGAMLGAGTLVGLQLGCGSDPTSPCSLTVMTPNGGESYTDGDSVDIRWRSGEACGSQVAIDLLVGGSKCRTIAAAAGNQGVYGWVVEGCADKSPDDYTVRIIDHDSGISDISDGTFAISPSAPVCTLTVMQPISGASFCAGDSVDITWTVQGECASTVRIELLHGGTSCGFIASTTANDGAYRWGAAQCQGEASGFTVRVVDSEAEVSGESPASFSVHSGCAISVTTPEADDAYCVSEFVSITWDGANCCGPTVNLELLRGGTVCAPIATGETNDGSYEWTAAQCDAESLLYTIRVIDPQSGITGTSASSFRITPGCALSLVSPEGGESFCRGEQVGITWNSSACCGDSVRLELYRVGEECQPIAEATANDGEYTWTASQCEDEESGYRVRVTDPGSGTWSESGATFRIRPRCTIGVDTPAADDVFCAGESVEIFWQVSSCCGDKVRIELLRVGEWCAMIADSTENDETHTWIAAQCDGESADYSVRVIDLDSESEGESSGSFFIHPACELNVTAPADGEAHDVGQSVPIRWETLTSCCGDSVQLDLVRDGSACLPIADATPNDGEFDWTAEQCESEIEGYAVRVTDLGSGATSESEGGFSIHPGCSMAVTSPAGGESFCAGDSVEIAWTRSAECGAAVSIEVVRDEVQCLLIDEYTDNDGSYEWVVTQCALETDGFVIRVNDLDTSTSVVSASTFAIHPGCGVDVSYPAGGESFCVGDEIEVTWLSSTCCGDSVKLELLRAGGACVMMIQPSVENSGQFSWTAEQCDGEISAYQIQVTDLESDATGQSAGTFEIQPSCMVTLTSPNGGESLCTGEELEILWDTASCCGAQVAIDLLWDGDVCATISAATENDGSFTSSVAQCESQTQGYAVRVTDLETASVDSGDATFEIHPACGLSVGTPNGGESYCVGQEVTLEWTASTCCGDNVKLELLRQGGACVMTIEPSVENNGEYTWPAVQCDGESAGHQIRVTDLTSGISAQSSGTFTVNPSCSITVNYPDGGESLCAGDEVAIAWEAASCCGDRVKIELLRNGAACEEISPSTVNDGSHTWEAEQCEWQTSGYQIRITDIDSEAYFDSETTFEIQPACTITVSDPNGGEKLCEGESVGIEWEYSSCCGSMVEIKLMRGTACYTISPSTANDGLYTWSSASRCSGYTSGYTVLVRDLGSGVGDQSDASFEINPECFIDVTEPDGGDYLAVGDQVGIEWDSSPCCGSTVTIELLHNGSVRETIATSATNDGSHDWTAAQWQGERDGYQIRVTDNTTDELDDSGEITIGVLVRPGGSGTYATIQAAIDAASSGQTIDLDDGTFTGDGNRDLDFGGKELTLQGLNGDASDCVIDCQGAGRGIHLHSGEGSSTVLQDFTIRNGVTVDEMGAGLLCDPASPTVRRCAFESNQADGGWDGGGFYASSSSVPTFTGCTFSTNVARIGAGGRSEGSGVSFIDCLFVGNAGPNPGGGLDCASGTTITDCAFEGNHSSQGGAVNIRGTGVLDGCTFCGNSSTSRGGAVKATSVTMDNCTFYADSAGSGGVIDVSSSLVIRNTIVAFSVDGRGVYCDGATATLSCCDVYGNLDGDWTSCIADQLGVDGNISMDPLFCNPGSDDFHLQPDSPCDAGCGLMGAWPVGCGLLRW